jgi:hypothetical protein
MEDPRFVTAEHLRIRNALRIAGPCVLAIGVLCLIVAVISMFTANGEPPYGWLAFVGMPLIFVGGVCSGYGFLGAMARYAAREGAPVAVDAANYVAEGTQPGLTTAARAVATGVREGLTAPTSVAGITCPRCSANNDSDARFCKSCGTAIAT